jgi:hypothetical protein
MPIGLINAPSTFQAVMNDVFMEYLGDFVMFYIDNILIFSRTEEDHFGQVKLILEILRQLKLLQNCLSASLTEPHYSLSYMLSVRMVWKCSRARYSLWLHGLV